MPCNPPFMDVLRNIIDHDYGFTRQHVWAGTPEDALGSPQTLQKNKNALQGVATDGLIVDQAFQFAANTEEAWTVPNPTVGDMDTQSMLVACVFQTVSGADGEHGLVGKRNGTDDPGQTGEGWEIELDDQGRLVMLAGPSSNSLMVGSLHNDGQWHVCVIAYNASDKTVRLGSDLGKGTHDSSDFFTGTFTTKKSMSLGYNRLQALGCRIALLVIATSQDGTVDDANQLATTLLQSLMRHNHTMTVPSYEELFDTGQFRAKNNQWTFAVEEFEEALVTIYDCLVSDRKQRVSLDMDNAALTGALDKIAGVLVDLGNIETQYHLTDLEKKLLDTLQTTLGSNGNFMRVSLFPNSSTSNRRWLVTFFTQQMSAAGTDFGIPSATSSTSAYLLSIRPENVFYHVLQDHSPREKLAYGFAQLAKAQSGEVLDIYTEIQILDGIAFRRSRVETHYSLALTLYTPGKDGTRQSYAWALRHFGEMYRDAANSWGLRGREHRSLDEDSVQTRRANYIKAVILYAASIQEDPSVWAAAHLGAAIINFRGFLHDDHQESNLVAYVKKVLEGVQSRNDGVPVLATLEDIAVHCLEYSVHEHHFLYPWAQAYLGWAYILKALQDQSSQSSGVFLEGVLHVSKAIVEQPSMVEGFFEPGVLHINPFFEFAIYYTWKAQKRASVASADQLKRLYAKAWHLTLSGLNHLSGFSYFLPGLEEIIGVAHLVLIISSIRDYNFTSIPGSDIHRAPLISYTSHKNSLYNFGHMPIEDSPMIDDPSYSRLVVKLKCRIEDTLLYVKDHFPDNARITMGKIELEAILASLKSEDGEPTFAITIHDIFSFLHTGRPSYNTMEYYYDRLQKISS